MCVLAILLDRVPDVPLVVAATRDEAYTRPSDPPRRWDNDMVAPRDLKAGGTWIGISPVGRVVAVTNRFAPPASPDLRSRGLLVREALMQNDPRGWIRAEAESFAGFNVAVLERGTGWVLHYDGALREVELGPGVYVLTTDQDCDEPGMAEAEVVGRSRLDLEALPGLLGSHEGDPPICKHGPVRGTVSSSIIGVHKGGPTRSIFLHASGPPCQAPFEDYSDLLRSG